MNSKILFTATYFGAGPSYVCMVIQIQTMTNSQLHFVPMEALIAQALEQIESARDYKFIGVPSGFPRIDSITRGWQKGNLIIIASQPYMGQTSFILSLARNAAVDFQKPVGMFSLDLTRMQVTMNLIAMETGIYTQTMLKGELRNKEFGMIREKIKKLTKAPLFIDDTSSLSISEFYSRAKQLREKQNIELIIVDYPHLMEMTNNDDRMICDVPHRLKEFANELNIPIIAVSQLSEGVGRRRPQLSDLRQPFDIEKDADVIVFLNRPDLHGIIEDEEGNSTKGIIEIMIAKNINGRIGNERMFFNAENGKISEVSF